MSPVLETLPGRFWAFLYILLYPFKKLFCVVIQRQSKQQQHSTANELPFHVDKKQSDDCLTAISSDSNHNQSDEKDRNYAFSPQGISSPKIESPKSIPPSDKVLTPPLKSTSAKVERPTAETPEGFWNRKRIESIAKSHSPIGLSLSGCGFLGVYHFGVVMCMQQNAKGFLSRITHFAGASGGSLMAALLILAPNSIAEGLIQLYELADELQRYRLGALTPGFNFAHRLTSIVDRFLPDDISSINGRLFISMTKQSDRSNRIVSVFPSRKYLMDCLMASCFIPFYSNSPYAYPPKIDGDYYIDGGYSNNLPILENIPTLTISPFSGSAIITPKDTNLFDWKMTLGSQVVKVNMQNVVRGAQALFPPKRKVLTAYFDMGFINAMKFLHDTALLERPSGDPV